MQAGGRRFDPVWLHQLPSLFAEIRARVQHLSVQDRARRFNAPSHSRSVSALAKRAKFRELVIDDEFAHLLHREEGIDLGLL